jgi:hypothetical protein
VCVSLFLSRSEEGERKSQFVPEPGTEWSFRRVRERAEVSGSYFAA